MKRTIKAVDCFESKPEPGYFAAVVIFPFREEAKDAKGALAVAGLHATMPKTFAGGRLVVRAAGAAMVEYPKTWRSVVFVALESSKDLRGASEEEAREAVRVAVQDVVKFHDGAREFLRPDFAVLRSSNDHKGALHLCLGRVVDVPESGVSPGSAFPEFGAGAHRMRRLFDGGDAGSSANN